MAKHKFSHKRPWSLGPRGCQLTPSGLGRVRTWVGGNGRDMELHSEMG